MADRAGKILSKRLGSLLSAKLVKLTPVATDEHFQNGGAKKAVQDIDYMTTCLMQIVVCRKIVRTWWESMLVC